ncbi:MAG: 2,3-bisphosphoglycerate-independent phosphoglycerate mutase [Proteobacteria bacterium]|nr:2,3-bisphosphoglycerate-independent phosphoglycerate mutase [Pseudomonadota bacterium]
MTQLSPSIPKPVVLCILDGWGHREEKDSNAIAAAHTPVWNRLVKQYPHSLLGTSGLDVGLPEGQMGNSEVGHMNIGAGRVVMQDLPRIDLAIKDGSLAKEAVLRDFIAKLKTSKGTCHLLGLVSDGGVHAHIGHIIGLAKIISEAGVPVAIHAFTDGRDTPPESAKTFIPALEKAIAGFKGVTIATVSGRYYAMDRDNRWERVKLAYDAMASVSAPKAAKAEVAVLDSYKAKLSDEFIKPVVIGSYAGMKDGDGLLMANFRSDRARQILAAFADPAFKGFERKPLKFASLLGMVEYSDALNAFFPALFKPEKLTHILGEVVAEKGLKQLRIAETEKYAHVTFFFSGGRETEFKGEERVLIPSPKVATYDMKPEMSAHEVTDKLVESIESNKYDLVVVNYANTDMVGHTGIQSAAVKAVEAVDTSLGRLTEVVLRKKGALLITADHGNAEMMTDPETKEPHTAHTLNPVPFVLVSSNVNGTLMNGKLCDIAPTILSLMHIPQPKEMSGKSLLKAKV